MAISGQPYCQVCRFCRVAVWNCLICVRGRCCVVATLPLARVAPHSFEPLLSQSPPLVPPIPQSPDSVVMIQDCYSVRKGNVCVVCSQPIQTPGVKIGASLYHMECFQCSRCRSSIGANAGMCRACAVCVPCVCAVFGFHPISSDRSLLTPLPIIVVCSRVLRGQWRSRLSELQQVAVAACRCVASVKLQSKDQHSM